MAELEQESPQLEAAEQSPSIESLQALTDVDLHKMLGHDQQLQEVRKGLEEASKLTGKARTYAEERIQRWFTPHIYPSDFRYLAEDAMRATSKKDAKSCLCDDSPGSVL